ncbi:hypothetical protein OPT61_g1358 [Boeremia exigua]|uniref:Uncharacterized protein n=1 Tax=Boeremia exigua TaxID=749465 RepID=A0ACC2IQR6_9PLEO|nr:hypothetical protein OPT61_g1358 [Boeremia exigua]
MLSMRHILLSLGALSIPLVSSAPATSGARSEVPEVIPGPGLPSLASLGLTSEQLFALGKPESSEDDQSLMAVTRCGDQYGNVNNAIACYNYLRNLGRTDCRVPIGQRSVIMCTAGDIRIESSGVGASSWCEHVAMAVLYTVDHCTRPSQDVAGYAPAYGNGDLIVGTQRN